MKSNFVFMVSSPSVSVCGLACNIAALQARRTVIIRTNLKCVKALARPKVLHLFQLKSKLRIAMEARLKLKQIIILCVCIMTLGGCATKGSVDNNAVALRPTSEQSLNVRDFLDSYMLRFNSRDMDALVDLYAPNTSVLVFADNEGYVLHKDELLSAFEMKIDGWTSKNLQFVGYDMNNVSLINNLVQINVDFHVNSNSWNGKYATSFRLKESVGKDGMASYLIVKENM